MLSNPASIILSCLLSFLALRGATCSSAHEIWSHLEENLKLKPDSDITECEKSLLRIVENIKYLNYTEEALGVAYNSGKALYDVGYFESCNEVSNLTYYLIRPIRTDLKSKFSFGVCIPKECDLHAADQLIAENIINKHYLTHIANQTENDPLDFKTQAVVLPQDPQVGADGNFIVVCIIALAAISFIRPILVGFKSYSIEEIEESLLENDSQASADSFTIRRVASHAWSCFDIVETVKYLVRGRGESLTFNSLLL